MDKLIKRVRQLGFIVDEPLRFEKWQAFVGDYCYEQNDNIVSKYIFVQCDKDSFKRNILDSDNFTKEVIESVFYDLRNDLGWNLYLVCVMKQEEIGGLSENILSKYRNNRDFTRNLIVSENDLSKEIPVGKILKDNTSSKPDDPQDAWYGYPSNNGMLFCLQGYETNRFEAYINGAIDDRIKVAPSRIKSGANKIKEVNSLKLTNSYRPHCFGVDRELEFSKVNLLSGANGTGKTSILHAIELVMTGKIRLDKNPPSNEESKSDVSIIVNGGQRLPIPESSDIEKSRESLWHKNTEGAYYRSALNQAFHVYNLFSTEDTFNFVYNGEQLSYDTYFTKILFGEDTVTAETNWKRYKSEFN